ncbi:MAG: hypothetical protein HKN82_09050 [Akkermansiaceae bacterium]|nr:hypothetical protein [Akkermansiaceae bacterium]NNM28144.1 hypothetical protein [Akkermansiaceae bacterium]
MKLAALFLLIAAGVLGAEPGSPVTGMLNFVNGDRLSGVPGDLNDDGNLVWTAGDILHQPVQIRLDTILDMRLEGGPAEPAGEAGHHALLSLTNGDTVRGQLAGLDEEYVTLDTAYAGKMRVKRTMASGLEVVRFERALYSGPDSLDNWTVSGEPGAWSFHNGHLVARKGAGISREMELPERARLSFDLAWRNSLRFRLLLFSDDPKTTQPANCYDLVCQRRFVYMRKRWSTNASTGSRIIGQSANIRELAESEKVSIDFYIDRKAGNIAFYVDGRQAQVWSDQDPNEGDFGNWMHFVSEDFYPIRISRMQVSPWKGDLPENADLQPDDDILEEDGQQIRLQNGDLVIGEVGEIEDGVLSIKTKHADIAIPVERMRTVNLSGSEFEEPKRMKGDVRAWLREGGRLTFRLDAFRDGRIKGYSQTFGDAEFDLSAFSRLEFNIYNEDLESNRGGPEW